MKLTDIPGNGTLKKQLIQQFNSNRVAHAQLFYKADGPGALALAVAYAQYLMCIDKKEADSCGKCSNCIKNQKLFHPDLMIVLPHNQTEESSEHFYKEYFIKSFLENPFLTKNQWQNILSTKKTAINYYAHDLRNAINKLKYKPFEASVKVMIFWLPELFGKEGNVMLKIFEEPPENTIFILASENYNDILKTIQSRFQLKVINPFTEADIAEYLVRNHQVESQKAHQIALCSNGDISQALTLIEESEIDYFSTFRTWMQLTFKGNDFDAIFKLARTFDKWNKEQKKAFLSFSLTALQRSIAQLNQVPYDVFSEEEKKFYPNFSKYLNPILIDKMGAKINASIYAIDRNANANLLFVDLSLSLIILIRDIQLNSLLI